MLFETPPLDERDLAVIREIDQMRVSLRQDTHAPKKWTGVLRRNLLAKAIQGSNSIEGYDVNEDDAIAAVEDEEPLDADAQTWAEILGYRTAMSYVLQLAEDPHVTLDPSLVRSLHYMLLSHDVGKSPGRYRTGPIFVRDERADRIVYEGPPFASVPGLIDELMLEIRSGQPAVPVYVRAAMAHLNLVMIHPFRDGNGRMARCLQTLVLSRDQVAAPVFSSIEEFLGHNTEDYYAVLAVTADGQWQPDRDTTPWVRFNLRAHHIQAQTVLARNAETAALWNGVESLVESHGLPERSVPAVFDAAYGLRLRRSSYEKSTGVEPKTATRDLAALVSAGLLLAEGEKRGRRYRGSEALRALRTQARGARQPVVEPYFDFRGWLAQQTALLGPRPGAVGWVRPKGFEPLTS
jgi:Fic family protein